jgi:hypothetical protein
MSIIKRAKSGATAPLRRQADNVTKGLEDLIHAVKNELSGRFDLVDKSVEELSTATADQMGMMSSRISTLELEAKALRAEVAALRPPS